MSAKKLGKPKLTSPPLGETSSIGGAAYRVELNKKVHLHLFRDSFATDALRQGTNPIQLAQILGHSRLRMIDSVYSHLTINDAYDAMMKMLALDGEAGEHAEPVAR